VHTRNLTNELWRRDQGPHRCQSRESWHREPGKIRRRVLHLELQLPLAALHQKTFRTAQESVGRKLWLQLNWGESSESNGSKITTLTSENSRGFLIILHFAAALSSTLLPSPVLRSADGRWVFWSVLQVLAAQWWLHRKSPVY
jgi:hypothetical protein